MTLTPADARHLLRRAAYGGLPAEVDDLVGRTRADAVDRVMSTTGAAAPAAVPSVTSSSSQRRPLAQWWLEEMTTTPAPIVERLIYFWHSHFACSSERVRDTRVMRQQHLLMRQYALSDFRTMLGVISFDAAMLIDLDNAVNVAGDEQENFARELMELYTIGNGSFTEDEVISVARAWTGHNLADDASPARYEFYSNRHDKHDKTLFGITQKWDAQDTIDELSTGVRRDQTAWFLSSKLWKEFGDPSWVSADLLTHLSGVTKANNMSVYHTVHALFMRDEFWAPERRMCMIKPPIPWLIELQRRSGERLTEGEADNRLDTMGHRLFLPPSVAGWGHNTAWLSGTQTLGRARAANDLAYDSQQSGFFDGLGDMAPQAAVNRILDAFGVPDASQGTRDVLENWYIEVGITDDLSDRDIEREAFRVGAMLPEVNLA